MKFKTQAIVFAAGSGSKMTSIVKRLPKCLLPVGNHPMIFYPLYMLHQAGFTAATVVVSTKAESEVKKVVDQFNLDMKAEFLSIDVSDDPGTADALRLISSKIKKNVKDVIIMSCDIISDVHINDMLLDHWGIESMFTMLTGRVDDAKIIIPGPKMKCWGMDVLFREKKTGDIKYSIADGDYEGSLHILKNNLSCFRKPIQCLNDTDNHLYIIKRWVFDYILYKDSPCSSMISLKSEVIPHLIESKNMPRFDTETKILDDFIQKSRFEDVLSGSNSSSARGSNSALNSDKKICHTFTHDKSYRANKLSTYWMLNKMMVTAYEDFVTGIKRKHATANIHEKAQICSQSFVGKKTIISEKTNIKRSAIGNNCKIQPMVRITDSVLFDQVSISSGAVIQDSIICTLIDTKCTIKNCIVMDAYSLKDDHTYENEVIESNQIFS